MLNQKIDFLRLIQHKSRETFIDMLDEVSGEKGFSLVLKEEKAEKKGGFFF